ncbi:hypothetical protein B9Z55_016663 [Caenorhabditis nigoni]|uniref:SANT domain-containing protein n=1 Tax=Caenorhabditis nigoni TaxID=1611254 RepID=A0A2G5T614_9PELO|nr:hypothetical protein B9Z55_016663 [Caenorhabditis nigoni]
MAEEDNVEWWCRGERVSMWAILSDTVEVEFTTFILPYFVSRRIGITNYERDRTIFWCRTSRRAVPPHTPLSHLPDPRSIEVRIVEPIRVQTQLFLMTPHPTGPENRDLPDRNRRNFQRKPMSSNFTNLQNSGETPQGTDPTSTANKSPGDFVWAGCSDNVKFGNAFGRKFVDQYDRQHATEPRSQMNLHNNRVGRRLLANAMNRECKCHGVSGSCVNKTCWKVMPKFDEFAARLHEKYQLAKLVTNNDQKLFVRSTPSAGFSGRTERYVKTLDAYSKKMRNELIYLDASPNYCAIDVKDRKCGDKCSNICCGRGWTTTRKIVDEPCHHLHSDWCAPTIVNSWWLLSKADTSSPTTANSPILCKNVPGLTPQQKRMCHENPNIIKYLISGLRSALHTCEYTFQREAWNCAELVTNNDPELFVRSTPSAGLSGRTERYVKTLDASSKQMRNELIYLDASPNYCAIDVKDRECGDQFLYICCGRDWRTTREIVDERSYHILPSEIHVKPNEEESLIFERCFSNFGKNFSSIHSGLCHRSIRSIVKHYYSSKKWIKYKQFSSSKHNDSRYDDDEAKRFISPASFFVDMCENCGQRAENMELVQRSGKTPRGECRPCVIYYRKMGVPRPTNLRMTLSERLYKEISIPRHHWTLRLLLSLTESSKSEREFQRNLYAINEAGAAGTPPVEGAKPEESKLEENEAAQSAEESVSMELPVRKMSSVAMEIQEYLADKSSRKRRRRHFCRPNPSCQLTRGYLVSKEDSQEEIEVLAEDGRRKMYDAVQLASRVNQKDVESMKAEMSAMRNRMERMRADVDLTPSFVRNNSKMTYDGTWSDRDQTDVVRCFKWYGLQFKQFGDILGTKSAHHIRDYYRANH